MTYSWYRQPRTYALDETSTPGTEQTIISPLKAYDTDTFLRNVSGAYSIPSGPGTARWMSEIKSVDNNGDDIEVEYTRQLRVIKTGSGGVTTRERWQNKWDNGPWVTQSDINIPSQGSETEVVTINNYIWQGTPPPPGTYRSYQSYYVNEVQQGSTVEEGTFEVRGLAFANVRTECPFDPEDGPGVLTADVYALPGPNDSHLFSGWTPTADVTWEFPSLDLTGTVPVESLQSDGKFATIVTSWDGKNSEGETFMGVNVPRPRAVAANDGGGNSYTRGLGYAVLYDRKCPCAPETGEVSFTIPVPIGGSFLLGVLYLTYQGFNACRAPNSFGYGWSSKGSAVLTETPSGDILYRDEGSRVMKWNEDNGIYTPSRPDNYAQVQSLGNPGPPYRITFKDRTTREFDASGKLTQEKDRHGNTITYSYTTGGLLETISDGRGGLLTYEYGSRVDGQPISIRSGDPQTGRLVQFGYTGDLLTSITNPAGEVTEFEYNADGRLVKQRDVRPLLGDRVIEHTYDDITGRKRHSDHYGLWREEYVAYPWGFLAGSSDGEIVVRSIPEEGQFTDDGRGVYYSWDELGRIQNVELNRIGLIF